MSSGTLGSTHLLHSLANKCFQNLHSPQFLQLNGTSDSEVIADNFAKHFENVCTFFNRSRNDEFKDMYFRKRATFGELLPNKEQVFSVELLSNLLNKMKNGKAAGLDELTCEL